MRPSPFFFDKGWRNRDGTFARHDAIHEYSSTLAQNVTKTMTEISELEDKLKSKQSELDVLLGAQAQFQEDEIKAEVYKEQQKMEREKKNNEIDEKKNEIVEAEPGTDSTAGTSGTTTTVTTVTTITTERKGPGR